MSEVGDLSDSAILQRFERIRSWSRGDARAPHKPLLVLLALAGLQADTTRLAYRDVASKLKSLIEDFGPQGAPARPQYPFWRLRNDGDLWVVDAEVSLKAEENSAGDMSDGVLRTRDATGGFSPALAAVLRSRPSLLNEAARVVLEGNFPESLHSDILDAVGFQWQALTDRPIARRSPEFRKTVLRIYECRCAMCGFNARLGNSNMGVEAAHVRWHSAGGPDAPENGVCLCSLHHKAFDSGALTVDADLRIQVSEHLTGAGPIVESMLALAGTPLARPLRGQRTVEQTFAEWHGRYVFKGPPRAA